MLYIVGSLIFSIALFAAMATLLANFARYRTQMMAALRTLSLDGVHKSALQSRAPAPVGFGIKARAARPAAPAPRLAA